MKYQRTFQVNSEIYSDNLNSVFFNPNSKNMKIRNLIIPKVKKLYDQYWEIIKTSKSITDNLELINKYNSELKENDLTLLGLVTHGGQGLATANNGDFVGCIKDSKDAKRIFIQRAEKLFSAVKEFKNKISKKFPELIGLDTLKKTEEYLSKITEN
jgi:hypothetical protein